MISAVSYAHECGLIHCDIKPDNFILFSGDHLRLGDFGIAKVSRKTIDGSGTGTVGHMSLEQAMGKPSARSDVFSLGLIIYRMLTGQWPQYPFIWPPPGAATKMKELFDATYPKAIRHLRRKKGTRR
jgi:serine/threonine-protein kinase